MGITGLLPFLKKIQREVHVSSFRGKKAAIDAYCWLHRGAYSCSLQLVMKTEKLENLPFIRYCMKRLNLLRQYDITPVMVFDGGHLPTKSGVEKDRRERRDAYLKQGKALLKDGKRSQAVDCFQKCVDVSPEMALALIKECRREGIECVVAPYEADAQLAYLQKERIVDLVITEDSDMLVFGCKMVLFKLDESGKGKLVVLDDLGKANNSLVGFTQESFRQTCILSGCDYLASVPGIGLGKASKLMKQHNKDPFKVIKYLQCQSSKVPKDYEENFRRAEHTFLYQLVFDPRTQTQVRLNELPEDVDPASFEFAGVEHSPRKAVHMARGNIDPITHKVLDTYTPSKAPPPTSVSWKPSFSATHCPPAHIQARLPIASSRESRRHFKPPTDCATEGVSLGDEDLKTMYSSGDMEPSNSGDGDGDSTTATSRHQTDQSHSGTVTLSKFFGKRVRDSSSDDCNQPDRECVSRAVGKNQYDCDDTRTPTETRSANVQSSFQSAKKRLRFFDNEESSTKLHNRYGYAKAKKVRSEGPFSQMDLEQKPILQSGSSPEQSRRNPFSKVVTLSQEVNSTASDSQYSVMSMECENAVSLDDGMALAGSMDTDSQSAPSSSEQLNDATDCSSSSSFVNSHASVQSSYKTSKDFLTTYASYESSSRVSDELKDDTGSTRECSLVDCKLASVFRNKSTMRAPLSGSKANPSNKKGKMKIGLSRPGSSSRFNAPRSTTVTLTQTTFGSKYNYQKKEQMNL